MTPAERYTRGAIAFHWAIALLVVINLWLGLFDDSLPRDWSVIPVHKAIGITVLALSVARLIWRWTHRPPPFPDNVRAWEKAVAKATHRTFYVLMIALPITGWMMVSGAEQRRPLDWFGLFPIPYLPVGRTAGGLGHDAHEILGYAFAVLIVLHVVAALRHHLILRDPTLVRMLPVLRAPRA